MLTSFPTIDMQIGTMDLDNDLVKEDHHHPDGDQLVVEEQKQVEMQTNGVQDKPEHEQQPEGEP